MTFHYLEKIKFKLEKLYYSDKISECIDFVDTIDFLKLQLEYNKIDKNYNTNFVVFGTGSYSSKILSVIKNKKPSINIPYFLDNFKNDNSIKKPTKKIINDFPILIASSYKDEIKYQLKELSCKYFVTYDIIDFYESFYKGEPSHNLSTSFLEIISNVLYKSIALNKSLKKNKYLKRIFNSHYFLRQISDLIDTQDDNNKSLYNKLKMFDIKNTFLEAQLGLKPNISKVLSKRNIYNIDLMEFAYVYEKIKLYNTYKIILDNLILIFQKKINDENKAKIIFLCFVISKVEEIDFREFFSLENLKNLTSLSSTMQGRINYILNSTPKTTNIKLSNKKPKIALCISGQLRGYKKSYPSIKKHLIDILEPDIYIHTWKNIGGKDPFPRHANRVFTKQIAPCWKNLQNYFTEDELKIRYKNIFDYCDNKFINENELKKLYDPKKLMIEDENDEKFKNMSNPEKMYYKMYECHQLALNSSKKYDIVIRIRPDIKFEMSKLNINQLSKQLNNIILVDLPYTLNGGIFGIGDMFAIGSMENMTIYANCWKNFTYFKENNFPGASIQGHVPLAFNLAMNNIKLKKITNYKFLKFEESKKINKKLLYNLIGSQLEESTTSYDKLILDSIKKVKD